MVFSCIIVHLHNLNIYVQLNEISYDFVWIHKFITHCGKYNKLKYTLTSMQIMPNLAKPSSVCIYMNLWGVKINITSLLLKNIVYSLSQQSTSLHQKVYYNINKYVKRYAVTSKDTP